MKFRWSGVGKHYPPRVRGHVLGYPHPTLGYLMRAWPRKRPGALKKPSVLWNTLQFGFRQKLSVNPDPIAYETAQEIARGSQMTWRDVFFTNMGGQLMELTDSVNGTWQWKLCMSDNPQALLDLITSVEGDILYRDPAGWGGLSIGADGYVLTSLGGKPVWLPAGTGSLQTWLEPAQLGTGQAGSVSAGNIVGNAIRPWSTFNLTALAAFFSTNVPTAHVTPCLYTLTTALAPTTLIQAGPTVTGVTQGHNRFPLSGSVTLTAGQPYAACLLCRIAAVSICGKASSAVYSFAYNTNDTPPNSIAGAINSAQIYSGVYGEA